MIFVTVGTHTQQFNRLLQKVDELVEKRQIKEGVFAQTGHSTFVPKNFDSKDFLPDNKFDEMIKNASLVISHGGAGAIITSMKYSKKLIIVPRQKEFGEHTDSHQLDLAKFLESQKKAVAVIEIGELGEKILQSQKISFFSKADPSGIIRGLNDFFGAKVS